MRQRQTLRLTVQNIVCLVVLLLNIFTMLNLWVGNLLESYIAYINILFLVIGFLSVHSRMSRRQALGWIVVIAGIVGIAFISGSSAGAVCSYLSVLLTITYFERVTLTDSFLRVLLWICMIMLLWLLIRSPFIYAAFERGENVVNPNIMASSIYLAFVICVIGLRFFRQTSKKWLFVLWCICLFGQWELKSRTSMIITFLFGVVFFFFPHQFFKKRKLLIALSAIIMIMGCFVPMIYISLSNHLGVQSVVYHLTGKTFYSGREWIWQNLFTEMGKSVKTFLFGPGSYMEEAIGKGYSMHNAYLEIMLDFGVVGTVLFVIMEMIQIAGALKEEINEIQIAFFTAYLGLLVMSYSEVVILTPYSCLLCNMMLGIMQNPLVQRK